MHARASHGKARDTDREEYMPPPEPRFRPPLAHPRDKGATPPRYRRSAGRGMLIERDIPITLGDGVTIYADLFRPEDAAPAAPIIAWGPYGKHGHTRYSVNFPKADVPDAHISEYTAFEAPNPLDWVPHGYAILNVDPRGTWYSEGRASYLSPQEAHDFAEVIAWAGTRAWSNGRVGLSGVSYLTSAQWRVAELSPPHLAAINPWEGWTDTYREVARHGGIPETSFWPYLPGRWGHSTTEIEDLARETAERPLIDAWWESKAAALERITVPAYVVASWSDQGLHTRGTLEGFRRIASRQKWLEVHGQKKWAYYYLPGSVARQRAFFDHFLHGRDSGVRSWPRVRLEVRERYGTARLRTAAAWPIPGTRRRALHVDAATGRLAEAPPTAAATAGYATDRTGTPDRATFDHRFAAPAELVGPMALTLPMSCAEADDMDVFVAIQKLDQIGALVPFAYYAQFEDGPVALGWLRASHRALDPQRSTPECPVLTHRTEQKIPPGTIVPLAIEIWPSGTRFEAGETLRLVIQGSDIYDYPRPSVYARHEDSVNVGRHVIHTGPGHDARLTIPLA
jgi:uncharacterized protein